MINDSSSSIVNVVGVLSTWRLFDGVFPPEMFNQVPNDKLVGRHMIHFPRYIRVLKDLL